MNKIERQLTSCCDVQNISKLANKIIIGGNINEESINSNNKC